jgi:hypothetical protein
MQAPLGNIVRKMLSDKNTSKQLMRHIISGKRNNIDEDILIDEKKFRVIRLASINLKK